MNAKALATTPLASSTQGGWLESDQKFFHFSCSVYVAEGCYVLINFYATLVLLIYYKAKPNN